MTEITQKSYCGPLEKVVGQIDAKQQETYKKFKNRR